MALITDLPNEILQPIIDLLCHVSPRAVPALSQTCKRMHDPARRAFSSHVSLQWKLNKRSQVLRFATGNVGNDAVDSIRLVPQGSQLNAFKIHMRRAYDQIDGLCTCLSSLPNLKTFSIFLEETRVDTRCLLPAPALTIILKALPESVVNLELDTAGVDGIWETRATAGYAHVCHAISDMLPRLETLYLRLSGICRGLFRCLEEPGNSKQPTTKLRRVAIKVQAPLDMGNRSVPMTSLDCASYDGRRKSPIFTDSLFHYLLRLQAAGAFPDLQRFVLLQHVGSTKISVQDVVSKTRVHYPFRELNDWLGVARFDDIVDCPFSKEQLQYVVRLYGDKVEKDYYGRYKEIERAILHEVMWEEAAYGVRTPPTKLASEGGMKVDPSLLISKHVVQKQAERLEMDESEWRRLSELRSSPNEGERYVTVERCDENDEEPRPRRTFIPREQMALPSW